MNPTRKRRMLLALVLLAANGDVIGAGRPSSEWRFHRDILMSRADVHAVVHVHSPFATTLACLGLEVPPFHYMIAAAGGSTIRCAPYALFGTQALSDHALAALQDRKACLLGNHGMIATGRDLGEALERAARAAARICARQPRQQPGAEGILLQRCDRGVRSGLGLGDASIQQLTDAKTYQVRLEEIEKLSGVTFDWPGVVRPFKKPPVAITGTAIPKPLAKARSKSFSPGMKRTMRLNGLTL